MKKFLKLSILLLYLSILQTGCIKMPKAGAPVIKILTSAETLQFTDEPGSKTFTVSANSNWIITGGCPDCSVSPDTGEKDQNVTVTVVVTENMQNSRDYSLSIKAGDVTKAVTVKQSGKNYANSSEELIITKFGIVPSKNDNIFSEIEFIKQNGSEYVFSGEKEVRYYKTNLNALKASWSGNAVKVMVGEVLQSNGVTSNDFSNDVFYRFYAKDNSYKEYKVKLTNPDNYYSGLPVLSISTTDGSDITSKDEWKAGIFKFDPQGNPGIELLSGELEIKGRGNSTWNMPKKPYSLKLKDKNSGKFMGMNAHKRWTLLANYADKTGLRNRVAFEMGKHSKLAWTPDSRYVEVILNGKFLGNYLLTEQIKIDSKRVNIQAIDNTETNSEKITGGWLMEIDRYYSLGETRYFRPDISQLPVIIKEPEDANTTQMEYIKSFFNNLEKLIYPSLPTGTSYYSATAQSAGVPDSTQFCQLLDIKTFIDYWIIQEVTGNGDSRLPGSVYMYKDVNGKLCAGPLWDFDQTTFIGNRIWMHYDYVPNEYDYYTLNRRAIMYAQLFKDQKFKAKAKQRWGEMYNYFLTDVTKFIDQEYEKIAKSLEINWIDIGENQDQGVWALTDEEKINGGRNLDKNLRCVDAVARMKSLYIQRITWLNSQIANW